MNGPDGRTTHAVYGFVTMLRKLIADHQPEHIAAAFDLAGPTFRSEMVGDYKANRSPMPTDLVEQVPFVRDACEALGVPMLSIERFEADDVMGTLARQAAGQGFEVVLVTGDKDFFQLVGGPIRVYNPRDGARGSTERRAREVRRRGPIQVVDVLALMGDTIDNVKGVPGIGEKGARDLIATHGSLEALLAAAPTLTQKRYREGLSTYADQARESRELVTIDTDVPVSLSRPLLLSGRGPGACLRPVLALRLPLAGRRVRPDRDNDRPRLSRARRPRGDRRLCGRVLGSGRVAIHVLTRQRRRCAASLVGIALSIEPDRPAYVPVRSGSPGRLPAAQRRVEPGLPGLFDEAPCRPANVPSRPQRSRR